MAQIKHRGHIRKFRIDSQSEHRLVLRTEQEYQAGLDTIWLGFYSPQGGCSGELRIDWESLGDRLTPRLKAYDDSWSALANFHDVMLALAELDNTSPSVECVAALLLECGLVDATERAPLQA